MSTQGQTASQVELVTFLEKLAQFHATLSPREQAILDEMTAASMAASTPEVQGYLNNPQTFPNIGTTFQSLNTPASQYYYYYRGVQQAYQQFLAR